MFGSWFFPFWHDEWNILDFVVVGVSFVGYILKGPAVAVIRLVAAPLSALLLLCQPLCTMLLYLHVHARLPPRGSRTSGWSLVCQCCHKGSVSVSCAAPGQVRVFKMVRLFKAVRSLGSLRILMNALAASIVPVSNAFGLLMIVTSIYAILATDFFASDQPEYFGSFALSLFTLFQMATGDSWSSQVAIA